MPVGDAIFRSPLPAPAHAVTLVEALIRDAAAEPDRTAVLDGASGENGVAGRRGGPIGEPRCRPDATRDRAWRARRGGDAERADLAVGRARDLAGRRRARPAEPLLGRRGDGATARPDHAEGRDRQPGGRPDAAGRNLGRRTFDRCPGGGNWPSETTHRSRRWPRGQGDVFTEPRPAAADPAAITFSSGTSGLMKAVRLTHGNLAASAAQVAASFALDSAYDATSVTLAGAPFFASMGLGTALCAPISVGAPIVTVPVPRTEPILAAAGMHRATHAVVPLPVLEAVAGASVRPRRSPGQPAASRDRWRARPG